MHRLNESRDAATEQSGNNAALIADTVEDAQALWESLNTLLSKAKMTLRKWRTSSADLLQTIPEELRESDQYQVITAPADCHKALGIHWSTEEDTLHVSTPKLTERDIHTWLQT